MKSPYSEFIAEVPNLLKDLENSLKGSLNYQSIELNFDLETLNRVESYYLDVHDQKEKTNITMERFKLSFYAYIGEVFRYHLGGKWVIGNIKNDEAYGTPIILDWGKSGTDHPRISPYVWEILLLRNREKGDIAKMISRAYERELKNN